MTKESLLSRLASYSLQPNRRSIENFTTEIIAHLYNEDRAFRRRFAALLMPDQRQTRAFRDGQAETQVACPRCIADIVIEGRGNRWHFVEVKVSASEGVDLSGGKVVRSQIDRYLDLRRGNVTFLTTRFTPGHQAELRGRRHRVHHALLEHLYAAIKSAPLSEMGRAFVKYMEEQGMAPAKPLLKRELRLGEASADIYRKCMDLLSQFKQEVGIEFERNLKTRGRLTSPKLHYGPDWAFYDCYVSGFRHRGPVRTAGFGLWPGPDGIYFTTYVWGTRTAELKRLGSSLDWTDMGEGNGFETFFKLRGGPGDLPRMRKLALRESRRLGRAIATRF